MDGHIVKQNGKTYTRVNKIQARKAFDKGQTVWLVPAHVRFSFDHQWVHPCPINREDSGQLVTYALKFDVVVRDYEYYNCVKELGTYSRFYIEVTRETFKRPDKPMTDEELTDFVVSQKYFNMCYGESAKELVVMQDGKPVCTFRDRGDGMFETVNDE